MNSKDFIILMLCVTLALLVIKSCGNDKTIESLEVSLNESNRIKDSLGREIVVKDAKTVQDQENLKQLRAQLFETTDQYNKKVKEVQALIAQGTNVIIKDRPVPYAYLDSAKMKKWEDSVSMMCHDVIKYYEDSTVTVGSVAKDSTKWWNTTLTVQKQGVLINKMQFVDSQYVALTKMTGGFFRKNTKGNLKLYIPPRTRVEIKHTNPHFQNTGVDAFIFDKKTKLNYGNGVVHGAIGGVMLTLLLSLMLQ